MKLAVTGMSGSGKGEAIKILIKECEERGLTYKVYKEDTNPELFKLAMEKPDKYMFLNQLNRRCNMMIRDVLANQETQLYDIQIFDRGLFECKYYDTIFLRNGSHDVSRILFDMSDELYGLVGKYDHEIFLKADDKTLLNRIDLRGRESLNEEMVQDYISVNALYNNRVIDNSVLTMEEPTLETMEWRIGQYLNEILDEQPKNVEYLLEYLNRKDYCGLAQVARDFVRQDREEDVQKAVSYITGENLDSTSAETCINTLIEWSNQ